MNLVIFNGSPRNKKSNSKIIIEQFLLGYQEHTNISVPVYYLASTRDREQYLKAFSEAETCLMIFPLYTDSMPGIVKAFFESIYLSSDPRPQQLGFILQSGFPESVHSVCLERYLRKFTHRIGCEYIGTVIKGGVEGIQIMPRSMTRNLFRNFRALGKYYAETGAFSPKIMENFAKPFKMSKIKQFMFQILPSRFINFYWDSNLKKNHARKKRFDRPYEIIEND
ncbi:MAG: hypothetical protein CVT92_03595 [Bacteroidetes bacterium HGW-Bacteroidetes-1]|jgi:NAD(P)H-dependent FMN reductase|nr:MAG: hypothetical protein CVT92_03595 [Bacteroidetes bacterium HGW-Bacteroidetes-1]